MSQSSCGLVCSSFRTAPVRAIDWLMSSASLNSSGMYENAWSGYATVPPRRSAIIEMIALESIPPDRQTPTGTSLRIRSRTESSNVSRKTATGSSGGGSCSAAIDQKRRSFIRPLK